MALRCVSSLLRIGNSGFQYGRLIRAPMSNAASGLEPQQPNQASEVKPFSAIPKKEGWPLLGTALDFNKEEYKNKMHKLITDRVKEFGVIYREKSVFTLPEILIILDPKSVETVFNADGKWPLRPALEHWEEARKALKIPQSMLIAQGEVWYKHRQPIAQFIMKPKTVSQYYTGFNEVAEDFLKLVRKHRDPNTNLLSDVPSHLFKWSFESVSLFVLGKRLGCLELDGVPEECQKFISEVQEFVEASQEIQFGLPFHKVYPTKAWKALVRSMQNTYDIAMKYVKEKLEKVNNSFPEENEDFLTAMIKKGEMSIEDISINAIDLLGAGVDTTSYTISWVLYALASNPDVQDKLRSEILRVVDKDKIVTPTHISKMPYLRNCIKETMRLYPLTPLNSRILQEDVVLNGYQVPAGTLVLMPLLVQARLPELFPEPLLYKPERWEKDSHSMLAHNKFASLPFGFGPRMCVGRRIAELEMHIVVAHIIKNFKINYHSQEPMGFLQKTFLTPETRLDISFVDCK